MNAELIQTLVTNLGLLAISAIPLAVMLLKLPADKGEEIKAHVTKIVAALALVVGSIFMVYNARSAAIEKQKNTIEAQKVIMAAPPASRIMLGRTMGVAQAEE